MTSKERVHIALGRNEPDRVPVFSEFVPEVKQKLFAHFGVTGPHELGAAIGNDMLIVSAGISTGYYGPTDEYVCDWGITWKYFENHAGRYTEIKTHPLADDADGKKLEAYRIPDPSDEKHIKPVRDLVAKYGDTHFICASLACSIFEAAWYLHGLEQTVTDMLINKDYINALFDKVMKFPLEAGLRAIDEGVDMIWLGDDIGMQERMMMSPGVWREMLKPRMAALISAFKKRNPKIIVAYHSCGFIEPVIQDFIEIGLDVLNPIQPLAMDPAKLKLEYGDRLSFWGAIDIQQTLPHGSVEDIRNEVKLRMDTIGKGGGLLLGPAHNVQADTSIENILGFYDAARELGVYR